MPRRDPVFQNPEEIVRSFREQLIELEVRDAIDAFFTRDEIDEEFDAFLKARPDLDRVDLDALDAPDAGETPARAPVIPSPVDVGRAGMRAAVGWLQTALDGLGPLPAPVKARRNDRLPPEEAWAELLRARLPDELSDDLLWAPVAKDDLGSDGIVLTFLWRGEGTPVEPRVELFQGDTPLAPGKVRLTPEDGTLAVRLPALGHGPHDIATATPDEGSLVIRVDAES